MRTLIVEDDPTSSLLLREILKGYGPASTASDGVQAVKAVTAAIDEGTPFDLICLDVMMPEMDGSTALDAIRDLEQKKGLIGRHASKIIMTTALKDSKTIIGSYRSMCDRYIVKPIDKNKLLGDLRELGLIT